MKLKSLICLFMMTVLSLPAWSYGDFQTLEITNIKASGTGNPTISQYNRIFRAYTGITYTVPVGVIGGTFPYTFALSNAPSGMTIDEHTGVVTWTNPQSNSGTITVTVYDKDGHSTSASWAITVGTSTENFLFVNSSYSGTETGSISQPYNSIQDIMDLGSSAVNKIVYFREGSYPVPISNYERYENTGCGLSANGGRAHVWIGYPGETVTLQFAGVNGSYATWIEASTTPIHNIWFENLTFQSPRKWALFTSAENYTTVYNVTFDDVDGSAGGFPSNPGAIVSFAGADNYPYIVDCNFTAPVLAHGVGSLYGYTKALIERCTFEGATGETKLAALCIKQDNSYVTFRKNTVSDLTEALGSSMNADYHNCENIEICYNLVNCPGGYFNNNSLQGSTWIYRNTFAGYIAVENLSYPSSCEGPWFIENNVIQNAASGFTWKDAGDNPLLCVTYEDNLGGTSGIVDASGNLQGDYTSYLGTAGWQIADDEYYGSSPSTPSITGVMTGSRR